MIPYVRRKIRQTYNSGNVSVNKKKYLVLRLYNSTEAYDLMKQHHLKYDNSIFVTYDTTIEHDWIYDEDTRTIKIKGEETFIPGILNKTIKAIEICLHKFKFDVLIRSNMSTVIDMNAIRNQVDPMNGPVFGGPTKILRWLDEKSGVTAEKNLNGTSFVSGTGIVMSRDICTSLIANQSKIRKDLIDDVSISIFINTVLMQPITLYSSYIESTDIIYNQSFYRFNTYDRMQDSNNIAELYNKLKLHYTKSETILFLGFDVFYRFQINRWNGSSLRNGHAGLSGTHQSIILMAESLANNGYNVTIACNSCISNSTFNGVKYILYDDIVNIENSVTTLVMTPWNEIQHFLFKNIKSIIIWAHIKLAQKEDYFKDVKTKYPSVNLYVNTMTKYVKLHYDTYASYYKTYVGKTINILNPILLDIANPVTKKKHHSFIFYSSFVRGGVFASKVFDKLSFPDKTLTICSYIKDDILKDKYTVETKSKTELYKTLAYTEYLVYTGLDIETGNLTKETDCCAIAEALLHEIIVFAYPIGALYENYKDCIIWIPYPEGANISSINDTQDTNELELCNDSAIDITGKLIYEIDQDVDRKMELRKRGRELVLKQRNIETLTNDFISLLST